MVGNTEQELLLSACYLKLEQCFPHLTSNAGVSTGAPCYAPTLILLGVAFSNTLEVDIQRGPGTIYLT